MFLPIKNDDLIKELLKKNESETLDFKLTISDCSKIAKTLVAFANTQGGVIAIGINDQKKIIGIDPEEEFFMIEKAAEEFCRPVVSFTAEVYQVDFVDDEPLDEERYIILIKIPKSANKHVVKDMSGKMTAYSRVGDKNLPLSNEN